MMVFKKQLINYRNESLRIVYYHLISDSNPEYYFPNKALSIKNFRNQIHFFKKHYDIISLDDAYNITITGGSLKKKLVISFDDGFMENHSIIAPILIEEKVSATFFIITNCLDNKDLMWRNKVLLFEKNKKSNIKSILDEISQEYGLLRIKKNQSIMDWSFETWPMEKKEVIVNQLWDLIMPIGLNDYLQENEPYCSTMQVKELSNAGFGIGAHSQTHPIFSRLDYNDFYNEITKSAKIVSEVTGKKVNSFSYPFGNRAKKSFEHRLCSETKINWMLLGTKNKLNNYTNNYMEWERDNIEFRDSNMLLRFLVLPVFRSFM